MYTNCSSKKLWSKYHQYWIIAVNWFRPGQTIKPFLIIIIWLQHDACTVPCSVGHPAEACSQAGPWLCERKTCMSCLVLDCRWEVASHLRGERHRESVWNRERGREGEWVTERERGREREWAWDVIITPVHCNYTVQSMHAIDTNIHRHSWACVGVRRVCRWCVDGVYMYSVQLYLSYQQ